MKRMPRCSIVAIAFALVVFWGTPWPAEAQVSLDEGLQQVASDLASTLEGSEIRKIAVVEFQDINGYPSAMGPFIVEELVTQLFTVRPGQFEIVERRQLARVLSEQQLTSSGLFDEETIAEIGKILGIQAIVTGSIADLGKSVRINARAVAVATARVFAATSATVTKGETVQNLLRQAATPGASEPASGARPMGQSAEAYFQNDFLRVTVTSLGVRRDERDGDTEITLSLIVENLLNQEILIAKVSQEHLSLVDDRGTLYDLRALAGLNSVSSYSYEDDPNRYSAFGPRGRSTVVARFRERSESVGSIFSVAGTLVRYNHRDPKVFAFGISGIRNTSR